MVQKLGAKELQKGFIEVIPFNPLPVVDKTPTVGLSALRAIRDWASEEQTLMRRAFVVTAVPETSIYSYCLRVAFLHDGELVTSKDMIELMLAGIDSRNIAEPIKEVIEQYCVLVGIVPEWGTKRFDELKDTNLIWQLEGPHKSGQVPRGRKRQVIVIEEEGEKVFVHGPLV
jgi:hypothetical protein